MLYKSTRGCAEPIKSAEAIKKGIAPDGGLFVPETIIKLTKEKIKTFLSMDYSGIAAEILKLYLDDFSDKEIMDCVSGAYNVKKFDNKKIAPTYTLTKDIEVLELWHGPTCAFKDMALQMLPQLMIRALKKTGENNKTAIIVATSGDTGKAALEGFKDIDGIEIIVFFPQEGVSVVQKLQMITQEGSNVHSIGVVGNFDNIQSSVKDIFKDEAFVREIEKRGFKFSSANSINWGRLVPQIIYYFHAYCQMVNKKNIKCGEKINVVVPSGNFGNILAAFYAREMGLPVNKLICASNENNVLTDFINTGTYDRRREFKVTNSPAMDILISSNLERLIYQISDHDSKFVMDCMQKLQTGGFYFVGEQYKTKIKDIFWGGFATQKQILETIKDIFNQYHYLIDPHTAVGFRAYNNYIEKTGDKTKTLIVSTASPYKFNVSVAEAVLGEEYKNKDEFELLELLSKISGTVIPKGVKDLDKRDILHKKVCQKEHLKKIIEDILKIG